MRDAGTRAMRHVYDHASCQLQKNQDDFVVAGVLMSACVKILPVSLGLQCTHVHVQQSRLTLKPKTCPPEGTSWMLSDYWV